MIRFIYIDNENLVVTAIGELIAPAGNSKKDAISCMTEYLLSDVGREHFYNLHNDATEQDYYEVLYQLYEMEEREDFEAISSSVDGGECSQCAMVNN